MRILLEQSLLLMHLPATNRSKHKLTEVNPLCDKIYCLSANFYPIFYCLSLLPFLK